MNCQQLVANYQSIVYINVKLLLFKLPVGANDRRSNWVPVPDLQELKSFFFTLCLYTCNIDAMWIQKIYIYSIYLLQIHNKIRRSTNNKHTFEVWTHTEIFNLMCLRSKSNTSRFPTGWSDHQLLKIFLISFAKYISSSRRTRDTQSIFLILSALAWN